MSDITFCVNHNLSEKFPKERLVMESQIFLIDEGPLDWQITFWNDHKPQSSNLQGIVFLL